MLRQAVLALVGAVYTREVSAAHLWSAILNSDSYVYFDYSLCSDWRIMISKPPLEKFWMNCKQHYLNLACIWYKLWGHYLPLPAVLVVNTVLNLRNFSYHTQPMFCYQSPEKADAFVKSHLIPELTRNEIEEVVKLQHPKFILQSIAEKVGHFPLKTRLVIDNNLCFV